MSQEKKIKINESRTIEQNDFLNKKHTNIHIEINVNQTLIQ